MKTLTIINVVFATFQFVSILFNILLYISTRQVSPLTPQAGNQSPTVIDLLWGLWYLAFAIISLVYVLKKEKTT